MAIEYDGEPYVTLRENIEELMQSSNNRNCKYYYDFFYKYMLGDYKSFIKLRQKELELKGFLSTFFNSNCAFSSRQNYSDWRNLLKVLKQTHSFEKNKKYKNFNELDEYSTIQNFNINKYKFNKLKEIWKPYIDFIHNNEMQNNPKYSIKVKLGNF